MDSMTKPQKWSQNILNVPLVAGCCIDPNSYQWRCWWERWGWGPQRSQWDPAGCPEMPRCSWQHPRWTLLLNRLLKDNKRTNALLLGKIIFMLMFNTPHIVHACHLCHQLLWWWKDDTAMRGQLKICLLTRRGHYHTSNMLNSDRWRQCIFTQIKGKWGSS